jgi:serine/threonine protein kinase
MRDVLLSPPTGAKPATASAGRWEPPSAQELSALLPQYEIESMLGRGGMGAVYKGTQIALDRPVAIKILSNQLEDADASFAERFKNEAKAMAKLSHPGIVGVYDFGEAEVGRFVLEAPSGERRAEDSPPYPKLLYIVMEFVEGTDVAKMLSQQKRLHTEHAMAITAHVCDALAYAHERGIIHRDIKPANIMVGYDGVVKVADFGLAKMTHSQNSGLTQSGMAMGTLHYMAPEALMLGSAVDHRADIYAVGVMLYQMLTGKVPQGLFELPSLQVPGLDPRYDGIIGKALREDRELRYPTVLAMRHDLDAILTQPVVKVEPSAEKAPAALQTQARPQRPGGQPYRPPQPEVIVRTEKKSALLLWMLMIAMSGIAGWLVLKDSMKSGALPSQEAPAMADTTSPSVESPPPLGDKFAGVTKDVPFVNSLGMKFVPVPGTKVLMCIHETRRQDYAAYALENKDVNPRWKNERVDWYPEFVPTDAHPVFPVNWNDAKAFCAWLGRKEGCSYRLPTDREWSVAVGVGDKEDESKSPEDLAAQLPGVFHWGTQWPPPPGAGNFKGTEAMALDRGAGVLSDYTDNFPGPAPVMSFPPNPIGLHDLGGNISEWCEDWFNEEQKDKVLRSSAWYLGSGKGNVNLLASQRTHLPPDYAGGNNGRGFRCVIELTNQPPAAAEALIVPPTKPQPPPATQVPAKKAESTTPTLPTGPTTWTDTKGRSITATFKAVASGNVLLDIAGKVTPVPLNTLSAESQKLARDYHDQSNPATTNAPPPKPPRTAPS